jgi:hypothetical protein
VCVCVNMVVNEEQNELREHVDSLLSMKTYLQTVRVKSKQGAP